jgi:hypothetical protein
LVTRFRIILLTDFVAVTQEIVQAFPPLVVVTLVVLERQELRVMQDHQDLREVLVTQDKPHQVFAIRSVVGLVVMRGRLEMLEPQGLVLLAAQAGMGRRVALILLEMGAPAVSLAVLGVSAQRECFILILPKLFSERVVAAAAALGQLIQGVMRPH